MGLYQSWKTIPYINHSNVSMITTHERVKTSSMNEMNECNEFMNNDWKERPYIKQPMDYTNTGLYSIIYSIIPYRDYI